MWRDVLDWTFTTRRTGEENTEPVASLTNAESHLPQFHNVKHEPEDVSEKASLRLRGENVRREEQKRRLTSRLSGAILRAPIKTV